MESDTEYLIIAVKKPKPPPQEDVVYISVPDDSTERNKRRLLHTMYFIVWVLTLSTVAADEWYTNDSWGSNMYTKWGLWKYKIQDGYDYSWSTYSYDSNCPDPMPYDYACMANFDCTKMKGLKCLGVLSVMFTFFAHVSYCVARKFEGGRWFWLQIAISGLAYFFIMLFGIIPWSSFISIEPNPSSGYTCYGDIIYWAASPALALTTWCLASAPIVLYGLYRLCKVVAQGGNELCRICGS